MNERNLQTDIETDPAAEADEQEGFRQAEEDITAGRVYPAREVFATIRAKYNIPR